MSKKILLISEQQIKDQSIIEGGVDGKVLSKCIQNVQEVHLKGILGATLYDELIAAVELNITSGTIMSDEHKTLLNDYIQPYLLQAVLVDFMVVNNFKITNKGILKMNDNAASNLSPDELEYAKNHFDGYAQAFKNKLIDYLQKKEMTDWKNDTDKTSDSIGWYLEEPCFLPTTYNRIRFPYTIRYPL